MGNVELFYITLIHLICLTSSLAFLVFGNDGRSRCFKETKYFGEISGSFNGHNDINCWRISVPENNYVRLSFRNLHLNEESCSEVYLSIIVDGTGEEHRICFEASNNRRNIIALNDVNINFVVHDISWHNHHLLSFVLQYNIENLICAQQNHFRCSNTTCINQSQVCDEVRDCINGADEIGCEKGLAAIKGLNVSRQNAISWLKEQNTLSFGWGRNTPRAITALYLTGNASFSGDNLEEELTVKLLELQISVALLRNSSDPVSVSDLSMFINALMVTCHDPHHFYGYDLVKILSERIADSSLPNPGACLTLCNANWPVPSSHILELLNVLEKDSEYPFHLDIQAMALMALSCVKGKRGFERIQNATEIYNSTIQQILNEQQPDGSFGNVYTTALVSQALLSSGQENNKAWKLNATMNYIMQQQKQNSSMDFLSVYFSLPIFKGKSLADIGRVNCTYSRKHREDDEIADITYKLSGRMQIQYSLYIGDLKDVIHTMYLKMPENSSAYDVMRVAQVADPKYKFLHRNMSDHLYVYEIAGITNDPEAGKFWLFYTGESRINDTMEHHMESPKKYIVTDGEHLIMWYKTAHVYFDG